MSAATTVTPEQQSATKHHRGALGQVPVQTRSERFRSAVHDEFPEVTGREVEWRLTPVDLVRELIDGDLDGAAFPASFEAAAGATVAWVGRDDDRIGRAGVAEDRAAANAWSSFEQALAITIEGDEPVRLRVERCAPDDAPRAAHTVVTARPNSTGYVVLRYTGPGRLAENIEIVVEDGATLTLVTVHEWDDDALHLAGHLARVGRDATLKHIAVSLSGRVIRLAPSAHLAGAGGDAELLGVTFAGPAQHLEQRVFVHHDAPNTRSRVNYKSALHGEAARTVWVGDVVIGRTAPGTDSYEQNRNLMLGDGPRADSIPNLEIETGLIDGAGHASTTGRFDDEQLFYLQSRGVPEDEARRLVVLGFLVEVVQQIGDPLLEERLQSVIDDEIRRSGSGLA